MTMTNARLRFWLGLLVLVCTLLPAATSRAACSGATCNGKDPAAEGCNASNTSNARLYVLSDITVALRFSYCRAGWARASTTSTSGLYPKKVWMTDQVTSSGLKTGTLPRVIFNTDYSNSSSTTLQIYGDMAAGSQVAACATFSNNKTFCTSPINTATFPVPV